MLYRLENVVFPFMYSFVFFLLNKHKPFSLIRPIAQTVWSKSLAGNANSKRQCVFPEHHTVLPVT